MKRLLCLLCCLCLMAFPALAEEPDEAFIPLLEDAEESSDEPDDLDTVLSDVIDLPPDEQLIEEGDRPAFVTWLLDVARGELGYTEGTNNFSKYGQWSGDANAAWCAEFVCWCVDQVDQQQGTSLLRSTYPYWSGQNTGRNWFIKRGRFVYRKGNCPGWGYQWLRGDDHFLTKNEFIPRSGDLVFFSYNEAGDTAHVALIEYCTRNTEGTVFMHVIEGNNPSAVQRNVYTLGNSQVLGFGICEDRVDTTMRVGNRGDKVLVLQERLNALGLLEDRHLTGGYGSNTKRAVMTYQSQYMTDKTATGIADRETQQSIEQLYNDTIFNSPDSWLVED